MKVLDMGHPGRIYVWGSLRSVALLRSISEAKPRSAYQSRELSWFVVDF
jgi:hypothetical protein